MAICVGCNRTHDSWRAYCTNCMQTQAITKAIEESNRQASRQPSQIQKDYSSYDGVVPEDLRPKWIQLIDNTRWGGFTFSLWMLYMLVGLYGVHQINVWDFLAGFIFMGKFGNEI